MPIKYQVHGMPATKAFQRTSEHHYYFAVVQFSNGTPVKAIAFRRDLRSAESEKNYHQGKHLTHSYQVLPVSVVN